MTNDNIDKRKKITAVLKLIFLAGIIAGIPAFLYFRFGSGIFSKDTAYAIISYLTEHRSAAFLIIIIIQVIQVVICILPGQPIQFAASYMFGVIPGYILSVAGAVLGTAVSFYLAKLLGSDAVYLLFGKDRIEYYRNKLNSVKGLMIVLLIYLIPGVPKDLASYAAGISKMDFRAFIIVSTLGRSPAMLGSLLFGKYFSERNYTAIGVLCAVVAAVLLVCLIKRKDILKMLDDLEAEKNINEVIS